MPDANLIRFGSRSRLGSAARDVLSIACLFSVLSIALVRPRAAEFPKSAFDEAMELYKKTPDSTELKDLQARINAGTATLEFERRHGYLLSLLQGLNIPVNSQLLVASKTSPNKALISPHNPRALYYNDRVSVAYVPSAELLEIAASDPQLGLVFYTLDQKPVRRPEIRRDDRCLECHASAKTLDVPGLLIRSFLTKEDGDVDLLSGLMVTHRTPIAERWGGYYVTGTHGTQTHRGNLFGPEDIAHHEKEPSFNGNITDLKRWLDENKYPEKGSDIVALMVLEHQAHMQALLTRLASDSRKALANGSDLRPVYSLCEAVLKYMLFSDEAQLTAPICGSSKFAETFSQQGPKDGHGRSLRELDLQTRLFRYPCSFMIYSPCFSALPDRTRRHLYRRLHEILTAEDSPADFQYLSRSTRQAIHAILLETAKDLPVDWDLESKK